MALILFVDDEPLTLQLLSQAAEIVGHESISTESGMEVVGIAEERSPDLILMDLNLKETDGVKVLAELRTNPKTAHIPVIILSASASMKTTELVANAGADAYLPKPIRLQTLIEVIRRYAE